MCLSVSFVRGDVFLLLMNILDIIIAIPLLFFIYRGWKRGLVFEVATLVGVVVGAYAAIHFSNWVAQLLNLKGDSALLIAFFITFLGVLVLAFFLGKCATNFIKMMKAGFFNHLLGSAVGMIKALCVVSVLLNTLLLVDINQSIITPKVQQESAFFKPTYKIGNKLTAKLKDLVDQRRQNMKTLSNDESNN